MSEKRKNDNDSGNQIAIGVAVVVWLLIGAGVAWYFFANNEAATITETVQETVPQALPNNETADTGSLEALCQAALPAETPATRTYPAASQVLEQGVDYGAIFCTDAGAFAVDLFEAETPVTVNNMVFLAQQGYYNNTIFHRVIPDFMAQAGDPTGTGRGGPGYQFQDEFLPSLRFDRPYLLAMANAGAGTNGSQFFITFVPTPHLNDAHTIFGEVTQGQQSVDAILIRDPQNPSAPATMLQTVIITTN